MGPELEGAVGELLDGVRARVLVTGASGFLGSHLARTLAEAGQEVTGCGRNPHATSRVIHPNLRFVTADLRDAEAMGALCADQDVVFHVGALCAPWGPKGLFESINVAGTRHVIDGVRSAGRARLVHVSSTSVLFEFEDREAIEEDAPYPATPACEYAASKRRAEEAVAEAVEAGLDAVVVRARAIFGPGDTALLPRIRTAARSGRLKRIGKGENVLDMTYVENLVWGLLLAWRKGTSGDVVTITNAEPVPLWPTLERILGELGDPVPRGSVPYGLVKGIATVSEGLRALAPGLGEPPLTRYTAGLLAKTQTFSEKPAEQRFDYRPLVSVDEGVARTIASMRRKDEDHASVVAPLRMLSTGWTTHGLHLAQQGAPRVRADFHASFGLIEHPEHGPVLFDTGYTPRFDEVTRPFPERFYRWATSVETAWDCTAAAHLRRMDIDPGDVKCVLVSHFHADHIGGLRDFPNARFVVSREAWYTLRNRGRLGCVKRGVLRALLPDDFERRLAPLAAFADPGIGPFENTHDLFGDGSIRLISLPGHARGQFGVLVQDARDTRTFLVSDASFTRKGIEEGAGPHWVTSLFIDSRRETFRTLERIQSFSRAFPESRIVPAHCPEVAAEFGFTADLASCARASEVRPIEAPA